jgi:hypothetical protein
MRYEVLAGSLRYYSYWLDFGLQLNNPSAGNDMQPITYSLKYQQKGSDQFYLDLSEFTDKVLDKVLERFSSLIDEMQHTPGLEQGGLTRTQSEYAFDLLVIGVLWRVYAPQAESLHHGQQQVLNKLVQTRRNSHLLKPVADFLRGMIGGFALFSGRSGRVAPEPTLQNLSQLIDWLEAVGEFEEEVRRIQLWHTFLASKHEGEQRAVLQTSAELAGWFEEASLETLGKYTLNVEGFLQDRHPHYRWREDYMFTGRQRVEYHLNMVGTEIMNRAFRQDFLEAERKFIFVPPCMSAPKDGKCQAISTPYGERCMACTATCQVHQVTKLGEKHGIQVFMIPDSFSPLASSNGQGLEGAKIGVVGVSCPLTIINGGYEMRRMGIPAQGLLLNYCGCTWHWDPGKGIVTELNFKQLVKILEGEGDLV